MDDFKQYLVISAKKNPVFEAKKSVSEKNILTWRYLADL